MYREIQWRYISTELQNPIDHRSEKKDSKIDVDRKADRLTKNNCEISSQIQ